jgi:hypothetical protein
MLVKQWSQLWVVEEVVFSDDQFGGNKHEAFIKTN